MDARAEAARGLGDIESFLYREAHTEAARRRVEEFTGRTDGLTAPQKRDIERWYLDEQTYVARMVTDHIAERLAEAERQHHVRIRHWLRGTLIGMILVTVAMVTCVAVVLGSRA
jgi:hypothetical protein